ncbi:hypothetical protein [Aliamphritea spongicola]|nr:hypothetical protein [Aliamphritea spongicola]
MTPQSEAQKITLIGAVLDAVLGALKIVIGSIAHSSALLPTAFIPFQIC